MGRFVKPQPMGPVTFVRRTPKGDPGALEYVLDCPHGTTTLWVGGNTAAISSEAALAVAVEKHKSEESCSCADELMEHARATKAN